MIHLKLSKESEEVSRVDSIYYDSSSLSKEELEEGVLVEYVPSPESKEGMYEVLHWNHEKNAPFYKYFERPLTVQEQLKKIEEISKSSEQIYKDSLNSNTPVEELISLKIALLKEQCSEAIYAGFISGENEFGYNEMDQSNFTKRMVTIVAGAVGPFKWKSKNNGVVELTKAEFIQVVTDAEAHQLVQQEKYWALEEEVLAAETNEDVGAVTW